MGTGRAAARRNAAIRARVPPGLRVILVDGLGRPVAAPGLAAWLRRIAPRAARGIMTLALASDGRVRRLNARHRGIDRTTDVLSFAPNGSDRNDVVFRGPGTSDGGRWLGDVVIATGTARRQARSAGHSYATELRVLALHGLLHLLGFDHAGDGGRMATVERRLRRTGGLEEGLIERHS